MNNSLLITVFISLAIVAANIPWISDRYFMLIAPKKENKPGWSRWAEWLFLYFVIGFLGIALERKFIGSSSEQNWEFYVINLCLFFVFAIPGFIYRYDLKKLLATR